MSLLMAGWMRRAILGRIEIIIEPAPEVLTNLMPHELP
mgnify:CR=1 FL=1